MQGPTALEVLAKANGGSLPEIKFFNMGEFTIAGRQVRALHHGMSGAPGMELFGPWEDGEDVKAALVEAGRDFGLRQVGSRVYATNTLESGWIPCPLPAVFTGERDEGLPGVAAGGRLRGHGLARRQLLLGDIADYYLTPHDLGYWPFVKFDHDSSARGPADDARASGAQEGHAGLERRRRRSRDRNLFEKGDTVKYIDLPLSNYATWPYDKVMKDGR